MEPRHPGPIEWFTKSGRLLLMVTILGGIAAFYFYVMRTVPEMPMFFVAAAFILERCGIQIYRRNGEE